MNENKDKEISTVETDSSSLRDNFFSKENTIKPVLAYFVFTTKYLVNKKSTLFAPIFSFIIILIIALFPIFFLKSTDPEAQKELFLEILLMVLSIAMITSASMFSIIKALNLFKDISNDGMEILIVSKPIKRSQIIFVRFCFFLLIGIIYSLINYFALLIGLYISGNSLPQSFSVFNFISISFFTSLMSYVLFGSISIIFSLKFSTKLVSGFSTLILSVGIVMTQSVPIIVPIFEQSFFDKVQSSNSNFKYYLANDGQIIIYTKDIKTPLTSDEKNIISNSWNSRDDYSWIANLNNFINPVAGITKIANPNPKFYNGNSYIGHSDNFVEQGNFIEQINFSEFNASLSNGTIKNNDWNNKNYFIDIQNIFYSTMIMNLMLTTTNREEVKLQGWDSIITIIEEKTKISEIQKVFDGLLEEDLSKNSTDENRGKILESSSDLFSIAFSEIILILKSSEDSEDYNRIMLTMMNNQKIVDFNEQDFKEQLTIIFFYLYGLNKMNNNIQTFLNRELFVNSITANNSNINEFLGINVSWSSDGFARNPLVFSLPATQEYEVFINEGQKVSSILIGFSWSAIILIILSSTVMIYYRKDFS